MTSTDREGIRQAERCGLVPDLRSGRRDGGKPAMRPSLPSGIFLAPGMDGNGRGGSSRSPGSTARADVYASEWGSRGPANDREGRRRRSFHGLTPGPKLVIVLPSRPTVFCSRVCSKIFLEAAIQALYDANKLAPDTNVYPLLGFSHPLIRAATRSPSSSFWIIWAVITTTRRRRAVRASIRPIRCARSP